MSVDSVTELWTNERNWFGGWRNVSLQFWRSTVTIADLEASTSALQSLAKKHGGPMVSFSVLGSDGMPRLGEEERKRAIELVQKTAPSMRIGVQVIEGTGFVASLLRSVVSGVNMFNRSPTKVFANVEDAVRFLVSGRYVECTEAELTAIVESTRKRWNDRWLRR